MKGTYPVTFPGERLMDGYDYDHQAWVKMGRYVRCGHPESMNCKCYGRIHEGEMTTRKENDHETHRQ